MKNISRRVFIKGLAVAGVAAAASTVLAGCNTNMIPGVDDPTEDPSEEPSTDSNTLTWADPADAKKTLSITLSSMTVSTLGASDTAIISAKIVDDLKSAAKVYVVDGYADLKYDTGSYALCVSAYVNGEKGKKGTVEVATTYKDNLVSDGDASSVTALLTSNATSAVTKNGNIVISGLERDKWNKVSVKLELYHVANKPGTGTDDKTLLDTKTIDFSK